MSIFRRPYFYSVKAFVFFVFIITNCFSVVAQKRSKYEWCWAFSHPVAAIKVKCISKTCYALYKHDASLKFQLDSFANGGKMDAFRHVFFMAAFAQKVKTKKLRKLGIAHEKGNHKAFLHSKKEEGELADSLSTVMDLQNNELGFVIGKENKKASIDSLKTIVISGIIGGKAVIMKRQRNGTYLDCNGNLINLGFFTGKWFIPKCMVSSDYQYQ